MPLVTHFCGVCGCRVPSTDLEEGRAAVLDHVTYCGACAEQAGIEPQPSEPEEPSASTPPRSAPPRREPRPAAGPASSPRPTTARRVRASTRSRAGRPEAPAPKRGALIGGVLAGVALLAIVAGFAISGSGDDSSETTATTTPAAVAPAEPAGPGAAEMARQEARVIAVRNLARQALESLRGGLPAADASLHDLLGAREDVARGVEEIEKVAAELEEPDGQVSLLISRGRGVRSTLERRIESAAEALALKPLSTARKFMNLGHHARAVKALETMPSGLSETSWGTRWDEAHQRAEDALREHLVAEARQRDDGWTYVFTGESLAGWNAREGMQIDIIRDEIGYNILKIENPSSKSAGVSFAAPGASDSKSYHIRVDVRGVKDWLGIHVLGPDEDGRASGLGIPASRLPRTDGWWTLQIDMENGRYRVYLDSRKVTEKGEAKGVSGAFGLLLKAGGRVQIRNVRIKIDG